MSLSGTLELDRGLGRLSPAERAELVSLLEEQDRRISRRKLFGYYPETGPLRRELYPRHMEFFRLGATYPTRGALACNRGGKTEGLGGYEIACHLTGIYPAWWAGRRFEKPILAWAAGLTRQTTRDILQLKLLGPHDNLGTGLIPGDLLGKASPMPGVPNAFESVLVRHVTGRWSRLHFKSYDQGWETFQGTEIQVIWLDEESNDPLIRGECVKRLSDSNGLLIETFTPLRGTTPTVRIYREGASENELGVIAKGDKACVRIEWDQAPHVTPVARERMLANNLPYLHDAIARGIPALGSGAIYPVPESDFVIDDIPIPAHWAQGYAMDVGWERTAVLWGALDRDKDTLYLVGEHYRSHGEPAVHREAVAARGLWMPGVIDPAAHARSQKDGEQLLAIYRQMGLRLQPADNSIQAGLLAVWQRLSTGRIKVCRSLVNWLSEFRMYCRDAKGRIVQQNDHLMDTTRYLVMSGLPLMTTRPSGQSLRQQTSSLVIS